MRVACSATAGILSALAHLLIKETVCFLVGVSTAIRAARLRPQVCMSHACVPKTVDGGSRVGGFRFFVDWNTGSLVFASIVSRVEL